MKWFLLVLCLTFTACAHPPPTITTPAGHAAFTADQVVLRINELEKAAIAAEAGGAIPTPIARSLVTFCVGADRTLALLPQGWQQTVAGAWAQVKTEIGPQSQLSLIAAIGAVDVAILSLTGGVQ